MRIHLDAIHGAKVQHQRILAHRQSGHVVAAPAHGHRDLRTSGEPDGGANVLGIQAAGDSQRMPVNRAVPHTAALLVLRLATAQHRAAQGPGQFIPGRCVCSIQFGGHDLLLSR
jgi:hypothetical protein